MPTSTRKAKPTPKNQPQPFKQTLNTTFPLAPIVAPPTISRRHVYVAGAIVIFALIGGILGGLAIQGMSATMIIAAPGAVAAVTNPRFDRITEGKTVAATAAQVIQQTAAATTVQPVNVTLTLQGSVDINRLQSVLSSYDAQGSVNGPAL